jgi:hypothetical protein
MISDAASVLAGTRAESGGPMPTIPSWPWTIRAVTRGLISGRSARACTGHVYAAQLDRAQRVLRGLVEADVAGDDR